MQISTCVLSPWAHACAPDYSCQGCNQLWGATTCCQNGHLSVMFCRFSDCSLKGFYQEVLNMSRHGAGAITFIQMSLKYPKQNMWILSKDWLYLKKKTAERENKKTATLRDFSHCAGQSLTNGLWTLQRRNPRAPKLSCYFSSNCSQGGYCDSVSGSQAERGHRKSAQACQKI